jgi:hypothetical protein
MRSFILALAALVVVCLFASQAEARGRWLWPWQQPVKPPVVVPVVTPALPGACTPNACTPVVAIPVVPQACTPAACAAVDAGQAVCGKRHPIRRLLRGAAAPLRVVFGRR